MLALLLTVLTVSDLNAFTKYNYDDIYLATQIIIQLLKNDIT